MTRVVEVDPQRLDRWLAGFLERHGTFDSTREDTPGGVVVRAVAADGTCFVARPFAYSPLGLVLVRRGGYAAGLAHGDALAAAKVGSRHVQSRTAAGGWSQQRFARRRANQASQLVDAVVGHVQRVLLGTGAAGAAAAAPRALVLGGDRTLCGEVLSAPGLAVLANLPRREFYDLPDPTRAVLATALRRGRAYRIELSEAGEVPTS